MFIAQCTLFPKIYEENKVYLATPGAVFQGNNLKKGGATMNCRNCSVKTCIVLYFLCVAFGKKNPHTTKRKIESEFSR